ncbi:MAG: hypothetical protein J7K26_04035 [Candidatus Aenigmarchaeota archaeon]|nr:hypothetical protein [Candidatus Aenigmarchaeota archaeon]
MRAFIEIECKNPDIIIKSIKPDIDQNQKFDVNINNDKDKIIIEIKSPEISGLLAGINSYLKLIRTSIEIQEVE